MPRIYIGKYFEADFVEDFQKKKHNSKRDAICSFTAEIVK